MNMSMNIELLADMVHEVWANWMKYMFEQGHVNRQPPNEQWVMPTDSLEHWTRQMNTPYSELSEKEKKSDREIALRYLELIERYQAYGE